MLLDVADRPDDLRAADSDREYVAQRLRSALEEGRIDLAEFDERLASTYQAKTYGDLKALLTDLPSVTPAGKSAMVPAAPAPVVALSEYHGATGKWLAGVWSSWATLAVI